LLRYFIEYCKLVFKAIKMQLWLKSKGIRVGPVVKKSIFRVKPRIGDPDKFRQTMLMYAKKTREFQVQEGAVEPLPVTKIAGQPWWPEGIHRPKCKYGHSMNFVAQIFLQDVPLSNMPENSLLSFHYCDQCTSDGRTSYGWIDKENRGYDLYIFHDIDKRKPDMRGLLAPSMTKSYNVSFRDVEEVPGGLCEDANIEPVDEPRDFPQGRDDFDEDIYPGLKHVAKSKIGGWPTWVQFPEWPANQQGDKYKFLGQLDWRLFDGTPWCSGGYAYLFITVDNNTKCKAELVIQIT